MRRSGKLAALSAMVLMLAACAPPWHGTGTILDKEHVLPWCQTTTVMSGKTPIPITTCYPEEWRLKVQDGSGEHSVQVRKSTFDGAVVGQIITIKEEATNG